MVTMKTVLPPQLARRLLPVLLLFALPVCLPAQTAPQIDPRLTQLMQSGMQAIHEGKPAEAEIQFRQATIAAPNFPDAFMGLGLAQLRDGKPGEAAKALRRAIELNSDMPGAHMFLGIACYQQKKYDEAIAALQKEISLQPKSGEALTWLGIVELESGNPDGAVGPLDRAAALSPNDPNILDYRGQAHMRVAQESYQALAKLDPDSWHVHRALGESFSESGQPEKAIAEYQAAIKKQPRNADLYESLGNGYQKISRFDDAAKAYQQELDLSPNNPIALYNLGKIKVENGDAEAGVALLKQAVAAHASPAPADFYLGLGFAKLGQNQQAADWLEKVLASNPSDFIRQSTYYELVRVYAKLNRKEDSNRALAELTRLKAQASKSDSSHE